MRRAWSDDEIETVRLNYANWPVWLIAYLVDRSEGAVYRLAGKLGLEKSEDFYAGLFSGRLRQKDPRGGATRFRKGQVPPNKGLRRPGWAPGRMAQTQFKKGELSGRARELLKPVGTLRVSKDGYLEQKVNDDMPLQRRWRAVHLVRWEEVHGPIPSGHALVFKPGRKTTDPGQITADSVELVTRAELMRRNSYHTRYPKDVAQLIQLKGALNRKINRRNREREEQDRRRA